MKKPEIAQGLALACGLTEAQAADCLDRVVHDIRARLRQGKAAPLPGLGQFMPQANGRVAFRPRKGPRRG